MESRALLIVRAPLRVSLFGGGTDLPDYFGSFPARTVSFAVNKYVYVSAHPLTESSDILLKYSQYERVAHPSRIIHPAFRAVLSHFDINALDISVTSDVPAGTGLGSSSTFLVALLKLITEYKGLALEANEIADLACHIEINVLKEPIGKQDQYASALGGFNILDYFPTGEVKRTIIPDVYHSIIDHLALIRITGSRSASNLLQNQIASPSRMQNLHEISRIAHTFEVSDLSSPRKLGEMLNASWFAKKSISEDVSNPYIEKVFSDCLRMGAYGGKLLGAGLSGFLLMVGPADFAKKINEESTHVATVPSLDLEGAKVVYRHSQF
jgi:D-glycero-alpha-D-manno-heptose-7-phosphate kinase